LLIEVHCGRCGLVFLVCRRCWRGQIYCSEECRIEGMRKNHREAERRYRQTDKGKKAHREGENRRRHRLIKEGKKRWMMHVQYRLFCGVWGSLFLLVWWLCIAGRGLTKRGGVIFAVLWGRWWRFFPAGATALCRGSEEKPNGRGVTWLRGRLFALSASGR
jgi:hypothetical protein